MTAQRARVRLDLENRIELVGRVRDVETFGRRRVSRDPIKAMEAHHVIDAQHRGMPHVGGDRRGKGPVAAGADSLRVERRQRPVLALFEEAIGRGANRRALNKGGAVAPGVVAVTVDADWKVEIEPRTRRGQCAELAVERILDEDMIAPAIAVDVALREAARARRLGPLRPWALCRLHERPKARVVVKLRSGGDSRVEGIRPPGPGLGGERLEEGANVGGDCPVVDPARFAAGSGSGPELRGSGAEIAAARLGHEGVEI